MKNMWRLASDWGSYERPCWFWVGLRGEVQDPHLRPQQQMATCQLGSRWRGRGHCQKDWGSRKVMPHACRYKSPSPLLHGSLLQGWATFWEALHSVEILYKIISNSNYKNYIHSFRRNSRKWGNLKLKLYLLFQDAILLRGWEGLKCWLFIPKNRVAVKRLFRVEETKIYEDPRLHSTLCLYNQSGWQNEKDAVS